MAQASAPCRECGATITRDKPTGPIPWYCSDACQPRCSFPGCHRPATGHRLCSRHGVQQRRGEELRPLVRKAHAGRACAVAGCDIPRRKVDWCAKHYAMRRRSGVAKMSARPWATERKCVVCGRTSLEPGFRKYCGRACQQLGSRYKGAVPRSRFCTRCGTEIIYGAGDGRRRNGTIKLCDDCRDQTKVRRSYRLAVHILAHYQGAVCRPCGEPIDMTLRFPNKRSATIDHIIPLALGGTDDVDNLQLAHFDCNCRRNAFREVDC